MAWMGLGLFFSSYSGGHTAILRALIQNGAEINGVNGHGATALHEAACGDEAGAIDIYARRDLR